MIAERDFRQRFQRFGRPHPFFPGALPRLKFANAFGVQGINCRAN